MFVRLPVTPTLRNLAVMGTCAMTMAVNAQTPPPMLVVAAVGLRLALQAAEDQARAMVDRFLIHSMTLGMSADELWGEWSTWGETPIVLVPDGEPRSTWLFFYRQPT